MPFFINIILAILLSASSISILRYGFSPIYQNAIENIKEQLDRGEDTALDLWTYKFAIFVFVLSSLSAIAIFLSLDKQSTSENSKNLEETTTAIERQYKKAEYELLVNGYLEEIELTEQDKEDLFAKCSLLLSPICIPMMIIALRFVAASFLLAKFEERPELHPIAIILSAFYVFSYSFVLKAVYYAVP